MTSELGAELAARVVKAARYYEELGHASIAPGNLAGGLTTIEEKSIGAYAKSGSSTISGVIEPGEVPPWRRSLPARRGARTARLVLATPTSTTPLRSSS